MLRLGGKRLRRLLPVGRVELGEIAGNALLQLRAPPLHLALREVLVAVVDRLELAAVDGHARRGEQAHLAAQLDKVRAHLAQRSAVVLAEIGDRLVVGHKAPQQPQKLQIAPGFALEPPARLHAVEIAVDVELQENRGVKGGPPRCCRLDTVEPEAGEIERINEGIDCANRIVLVDPIVEALRQKRRLSPICSLDEPLHDHPRKIIREMPRALGLAVVRGLRLRRSSRARTLFRTRRGRRILHRFVHRNRPIAKCRIGTGRRGNRRRCRAFPRGRST